MPSTLASRPPLHLPTPVASSPSTVHVLTVFIPATLLLQVEEEHKRDALFSRLKTIIASAYPSGKLFLYGSCASSFGVKNSDIDVCLAIEREREREGEGEGEKEKEGGEVSRVEVITKVAEVLRQAGMTSVQVRGGGKRGGLMEQVLGRAHS